MNIRQFVQDWLAAGNAFETNTYLGKWHKNAVLEDPSVGQIFNGHPGIQKYFEDYFIAYKTNTRLINLEIITGNTAHIDVEFTGEFPGGTVRGVFDLIFKEGKIAFAKANLV